MTRIGVTFDGGPNESQALAERALAAMGEVVSLAVDQHLPERLREHRPDIVYNVPHGESPPALRLHLPAFLEYYGIPFIGSDSLTQATCVQRPRLMESLAYHGVPTTGFTRVARVEQLEPFARHPFPVVVRRSMGTSSCHATLIADDFDELESIAAELFSVSTEPIIVERALPGDAFSCLILGNGSELTMLPVVAREEHTDGTISHRCTTRLSEGLADAIEAVAVRTFTTLGCRDVVRVDVQLSDTGVANVRDVDPNPSLYEGESDGVMLLAAVAAGMSEAELVQRCLVIAAQRAQVEIASASRFGRLPRRTPPGGMRTRLSS